MKKTAAVIATVVALLVAVVLADRATRTQGTHAAKPNGPKIAAMAPDFSLKGLQEEDISLSQYKGKVVLVNFWATWCTPCRVEIPWLIELQDKYGPQGFTVLGVAMDDEGKSAVAPFVEKERFSVNGQPKAMNYPILIGTEDVEQKFGGLIGLPTSILITRDGREVKRVTGLVSYEEIEQSIKSLL